MINKVKYAFLYIVALITGATELEKAEIRTSMSLASFESVKNSLEKTAYTIDQQINKVYEERRKRKIQAQKLEEEASRLDVVGTQLSSKDTEVRKKIKQIDELL